MDEKLFWKQIAIVKPSAEKVYNLYFKLDRTKSNTGRYYIGLKYEKAVAEYREACKIAEGLALNYV